MSPVEKQEAKKIEMIARTCHEANRAYCKAWGDYSQKRWDEAPEWQKDSAIKGVQFHRDNKDSMPRDSHESWLKHKWEEGWKYGPTKDLERKFHPCMMKFEDLPVEQQAKDYIFHAIAKTMLEYV